LPAKGYSFRLIFLKLVGSALRTPYRWTTQPGSRRRPRQKRSLLDRLYRTLTTVLDRLTRAIGLAPSSTNENKIPLVPP
jgi:hypothetical protein